MKKSMVVASIVLLIVALSGGVAHAQDPTVWIWAGCDECTRNVTTTDVIGFNDGWAAATPGLLKLYLKENHTSLVLTRDDTGEVVFSLSDAQVAGMYSGVGYGPPDEVMWWPGLACPMPHLYYNDWNYVTGSLPVGSYTLVETSTLDHPVNDAFHTCTAPDEDGNMARITSPPSLYWPGAIISTVHIVVSPS
jgi:hypothetical protein